MFPLLSLALAGSPAARAGDAPPVPSSSPQPPLAPRPFTPEQIRSAMPTGTRISMRLEALGESPRIERWTVTESTAEACTIATSTHDAATGALHRDEGARTTAWRELADHASFPADATTMTTGTFTGEIGTHATHEYSVLRSDGSVHTFRFATDLPGPPAEMVIERGGQVVFRMTQILRQPG